MFPLHIQACGAWWPIPRTLNVIWIMYNFIVELFIWLQTDSTNLKLDVFVKHRCPRQQQSQNMAKISKKYILTLPHPQGHVMSVKCEEPKDEILFQVW